MNGTLEAIAAFLGRQPLLAFFFVVAAGDGLGALNLKGFSLGVGAVLFTGIAAGALFPASQPPPLVGTLGLVMFLYAIGVQFGGQFFQGLAGTTGRRYNALALAALGAATATAFLELRLTGISHPLMAGLFAGAGTNTAAMQAAIEAAKNNDPAVGYSVAYPFGMIGAILCLYALQVIARPDPERASRSGLEMAEIAVHSPEAVGRTLREISARLPEGVSVLAVRAGGKNRHPEPDLLVADDDVLLVGGLDPFALETVRSALGRHAPGRVTGDQSRLAYLRVFVSRTQIAGRRVSELGIPPELKITLTHVERGDTPMMLTDQSTLEPGDAVGLLTERANFPAVRRFFGNSIRGTSEVSYVSLGVGMMAGVFLGLVPLPIPGLGTIRLGVAGGTLIAALGLGRLRRTGRLSWTMPFSANLTLRDFGLSIFLAQVGMATGAPFLAVVREHGPALLAAGAVILLALAVTPLALGHWLMKVPFADLLGVVSGVTGTPPILAYAYRAYPSERVEMCYAMVYPATTILKIVIAHLIIRAGAGG